MSRPFWIHSGTLRAWRLKAIMSNLQYHTVFACFLCMLGIFLFKNFACLFQPQLAFIRIIFQIRVIADHVRDNDNHYCFCHWAVPENQEKSNLPFFYYIDNQGPSTRYRRSPAIHLLWRHSNKCFCRHINDIKRYFHSDPTRWWALKA